MVIVADGRTAIGDLVLAICDRLNFAYEDVAEILIEPANVTALVYLRNEEGKKYTVPPTYGAACARVTRRVTT